MSSILRLPKVFFLLTLLFSGYFVSHAEEPHERVIIDSLYSTLAHAKGDSDSLALYLKLFYYHRSHHPEAGLLLKEPALLLARRIGDASKIARAQSDVGRLYYVLGRYDEALILHQSALHVFDSIGDKQSTMDLLIFIAQDYGDGGKYDKALEYFKKANDLARAQGDTARVAELFLFSSWVYHQLGDFTRAARENLEAMRLYDMMGDEYGVSIALSNIADEMLAMENYTDAIRYYEMVLPILKKTEDWINVSFTNHAIANAYMKYGKLDQAIENLRESIRVAGTVNFVAGEGRGHRGIGDVYMLQVRYDDALVEYEQAAVAFRSAGNKSELATVYSALGACQTARRRFPEAKEFFRLCLELVRELNSRPLEEDYYQGLERLDSASGDWKGAYLHHKRYVVLRDSNLSVATAGKVISTRMQFETDKRDALARAEQEKKDIRQRNIRNSITAGLVGALVFGLVVFIQRNKISKARRRSDELLLNILPSEVADELKQKGSAEARQFDRVTVMFTDFKGFTGIAERLTPQELVSEIDHCFKAFDEIIGRHGIEKIKTIGDSYMCAGGLPVPNDTHAVDVVRAALEIRDYMRQHQARRRAKQQELFEIRIGIHTGPVVAGIVGSKKFAYDIWGDTVNIASRMESSGAAGEVNISGATESLVRDVFNCVYRGKIEAKNKGGIDMYFVEGPHLTGAA